MEGKGRGMDIIQRLGPLAFASRLKRISERLMRDVSKIYDELEVEFQARWFPVMYLLGQKSPMSVTEIARELGLTHPAINQISNGMARAGLIKSAKASGDERKRMLSISAEGGKVLKALVPVWKDIEATTQDLIDESSSNLLSTLDAIEQALNERDMYQRVTARIKERQYNAVEIIDYAPQYKSYFESLNREWLEKYFTVEDRDRKLLTNPQREIIKKGGFIFFARVNKQIIGTAALLRLDSRYFELAKMAVTESAQGKQVGKKLVHTIIDRAKKEKAAALYLHTSRVLTEANRLYQSVGFIEIPDAPQPAGYRRPTITMQLKMGRKNINRSES